MFCDLKWDEGRQRRLRGLNMAAVQLWAVNVAKLSLYHKLNKMKRNLVFMAWTDRGRAWRKI